MAIITSGITTLTDLNDAIISGTQPVNPTAGTLWIDSSKSPAVLKIYKNGAWVTQDLDLNSLDPNMAESIRNVVATIGNMSNDNLLDFKERQQIKDDLTEILGKVLLDTETVLPTVAQLDSLAKGSFYTVRRNALNAGMETGNTIYVDVATQYQNLKTYLESLTPIKPWNVAVADKDKNVTVVKNTFRDKWLQYYLANEKLSLATTEKIKEVQENLDGKIDEVSLRDKTEILSGNPIFTDKADDAVVHVGVDGLSVGGGSGKNLFSKANSLMRLSGSVTLNHNSTNGISLDLTSDAQTRANYVIKENGTYTISFEVLSNVSGVEIGVDIADNNGSPNISSLNLVWQYYTETVTVSNFSSGIYHFVDFGFSNVTQATTVTIRNIQVEKNSVATSFEPPAPSPDYPIAINSLDKSFDIVSSVGGRNSIKKSELVQGNLSGTNGVEIGGGYVRTGFIPITKGENYYIKLNKNSNNSHIEKYIEYGINKEFKTSYPIYVVQKNIVAVNDGFIRIVFRNADTSLNITPEQVYSDEPKFEKGSMATPYSLATEDISYNTPSPTLYKTNILLSEPLRSVGDVKDRMFLDTDGVWKVERNVGEKVISSGLLKYGGPNYAQGYNFTTFQVAILDRKTGFNTSISSHLLNLGNTTQWDAPKKVGYNDHQTYTNLYLYMPNEIMGLIFNEETVTANQKANQWISQNPITFLYVLSTPTIESLSAEQQTKLNNIQSFKGSNYVYTMAGVVPNLNAKFKSNMWYRMNVLGEKQVSGNRNWVTNGNLAYPLEKSLWSSYYKGTVREVVDISTEAPPFKNALHIKQTTNGVAGIIDAVIWEGAEANVLSGQNISMATWLKYQNISNESLVMQVQVTGKTSSGLFSYDYPKVFSYTGTDLTWKRQTGTVKINLPDGAVEITRVAFRLGLASAGTGEFWATGIQLETGNALGDWSTNPNDTEEELNKTEARFILTEKEIGLGVKKGELINGVLVNGDGVKIDGRNVDINGLVTFGSFDTTTKNAIDAKSTKAEAQGYATNAQNASKSYTDTEAGKIKTTVTAVSDIANSLKNFTDTAFSDGIIQRAEAQAISEHLNTLKKENDDLGNQYNVVYANANLTGTPKTNLASAKTAYNTAYTNLVTSINTAISGDKTTPAQKTDVDTKYTAYSTALKLLTQRLTESQTAVSEKIANDLAVAKANLAEVNAKAHADGKVTAEETRAINDAKAKLVEAQGYADTAVSNLEIGGRNLWVDSNAIAGYNASGAGTITGATATHQVMQQPISVTPNGNITYQVWNPNKIANGSNTNRISFFDANMVYLSQVQLLVLSGATYQTSLIKVPSTAYNARLGVIHGLSNGAKDSTIKIKFEKGDKATDWTPAPEDVDAIIAQAQTDATNAKNSASTANQLLADLSNDGILTPVEKKAVKKEWDIIVSEKVKIDAEATEYGITGAEKTNYNTHYNSLNGYIPPLLANLNANSNIVGVNFRGYFKNYYDARQDVLNAITSKAKTLADSAQGTADTVKGIVSNFDSSIINPNPIFLDWAGQYPAGYSSLAGSSMTKVASGNGMGNAVRFTVATAGTNVYLNPNQVTTAPFYEYVAIETTFKLDSGTIDGAGVLFRYNGTGITDHLLNLKSIIPSPTLNKWYTVTKVIRQATQPAGFTGYSVFPMGGWSSFGTPSVKVIQFDSLKTRQATEQEINAYESNIMIADMSSDSKITPVEKVQLKKEWATIASERTSLDGLAVTYGITTERTNMTTAYNTLNTVLNGTGGVLTNMATTTTVVGATFRAQFDDYYEKKAVLQRKVNEVSKSIADNATVLANSASTLAGTKSKTFTTTPTTPYVSGDVWKNGTAVYISTASRASGAYVSADWVLVGDVTSANTANDVSNVGGVASGTVRDRATNGNTAYASTSLWKSAGATTINGGQITTDTITSGAIKSDVALINKLFASDANINTLTAKSAFINSVKAIEITADKVITNALSALTANTGALNVTDWLTFSTDNKGIRATYDFGDPYGNSYDAKWYVGESQFGYKHLRFISDVYKLNSNNTRGSFDYYSEAYYGPDYLKLRKYQSSANPVLLGRVDITGGYVTISDTFDTSKIYLNPNGDTYFGGNMQVGGDLWVQNTKALKAYYIQAPDTTNNLYINGGRNDLGSMRFGVDGSTLNSGRLISSDSVYKRTYSSVANMVVFDTGTIGRVVSAKKYKMNIEKNDLLETALKTLAISPSSWFDKGEVESIAKTISDETEEELDPNFQLQRHFGFVADEFDEIGATEVVSYDSKGEIEGLAYDRLSMYHHELIKDLYKKIAELKEEIKE